jgi:hypothetical protein
MGWFFAVFLISCILHEWPSCILHFAWSGNDFWNQIDSWRSRFACPRSGYKTLQKQRVQRGNRWVLSTDHHCQPESRNRDPQVEQGVS